MKKDIRKENKDEALSPDELAVKNRGMKDTETEKVIDGVTWVKKVDVPALSESEIEANLKFIFKKVKIGRNNVETVRVLRKITKKLIYPYETSEKE